MRVAFIGLGHMGEPMARLLLTAGHQLTVYNRSRARAELLARGGAVITGSPAEACAGVDAAVSMLADDEAVRSVTCGDSGICAGLPAGAIHVSSSTISVAPANSPPNTRAAASTW